MAFEWLKNGVCILGEYKKSKNNAVDFNPSAASRHGSGIYTVGSIGVTLEGMHAFTYMQYMFSLTHIHINACASISARLASFTSLCMAPYVKPYSFPLHSMHTISILLNDITAHSLQWLAGTKVYNSESVRLKKNKKSPPPLPWVMFSKVDSLRRSKQEWMPRLDCEERQINETAHQLMRSSFVEIVLCGQFCFGDLKSVFGGGVRGLLITSGFLGAWSMSHREIVVLWGVCLPVCLSNRERKTRRNESKRQQRGDGSGWGRRNKRNSPHEMQKNIWQQSKSMTFRKTITGLAFAWSEGNTILSDLVCVFFPLLSLMFAVMFQG